MHQAIGWCFPFCCHSRSVVSSHLHEFGPFLENHRRGNQLWWQISLTEARDRMKQASAYRCDNATCSGPLLILTSDLT